MGESNTGAGDIDERGGSLRNLERVIEEWQRSFLRVGAALREIRDSGLVRDEYASFETYVEERWEMSSSSAYRQMDASWAVEEIMKTSPIGEVLERESQARKIVPLVQESPERAAALLERLKSEGGRITASRIGEAVDVELGREPPSMIPPRGDVGTDYENTGEHDDEPPIVEGFHDPNLPDAVTAPEVGSGYSPAPPRMGGVDAPVVRQFGSKWRMSTRLIDLFPPHRVYLEPFLGSAAVFLSKAPSPVEILNDLDSEVVNLFSVLRKYPKRLARVVRDTPYAEEEFRRASTLEADAPGLDEMERARRFLVRSHQGVLRQTGKPSFSVAPGETSRDSVRLWNQLPDHFEAARERLKGARIVNRDATEMVRIRNAGDVLIYADPPYVESTRAPDQYRFEMSDADHDQLLDALMAHVGPVFLSGYASDLYDRKLVGWESVTLTGYASRATREEVVWMNAPAASGARASAERVRQRGAARRAARKPPAGMGMVYQDVEPSFPEASEEAAVFGALLEGWRTVDQE